MARTRLIKPSFYKNEDLAKCDLAARILFSGLWCLADREGKLEDRPQRIKIEVLPYDNVDVTALLQQLVDLNFITRYQVGDEKIILINKFSEHQHPHKTEAPSTLPNNGDVHVKQPLDNGSSRALTLNPSIDTLTLPPSQPSAGVSKNGNGKERKSIRLKSQTMEQAKIILPRADIYALESEWLGREAVVPDNPDFAFLGYCKAYARNHPELVKVGKWDS